MNAKKKLTLSIDPRLNQRLDFQAAVAGKGHDRSSIVDALITGHIRLPDDWQDFPDTLSATPEPPDDKAAGRHREKTTFYVSVKAARVLGLHSQLAETNRSRVVEALIEDHVTPWDVYDPREKYLSTRRKDRPSEVGLINSSVPAVA
jgi:hypothetical protein